MSSLGDRKIWKVLDKLRVRLGLTHSEMAELLGVSDSAYERMRGAAKSPSISSVFFLAKRLGLSLEPFVNGHFSEPALVRIRAKITRKH